MPNNPQPVLLMVRELGIGGTERQLTEVAKALDRARFQPHVASFRDGFRGDELRACGVPVVQFPVRSFRSPSALTGAYAMRSYLRANAIRIVHTFDTPANVYGVPLARMFGTPLVISSQRAHRELSGGFRRLLRGTDRLAHAIVVNCESVRRQLIDEERVPDSKIHLCYNGIDTDVFRPRRTTPPPPIPPGALVIGVVCALRPEKGLPTLLQAFAALDHPNSHLVLVGSGPMREPLDRLAVELNIRDRCHFEPTTSDVATWLNAIDVFVLPSLSEALSNSLMEAMACGCCVVASRTGGNPELVRYGNTGLLFNPGDAHDLTAQLALACSDSALRLRFSDAAASRIAHEFTLAASATRMAQIYTDLTPQSS